MGKFAPERYETTANYACPNCARPTLGPADGEIVAWRCGVCGTRVKEQGGNE